MHLEAGRTERRLNKSDHARMCPSNRVLQALEDRIETEKPASLWT
jgi:hypothetical protein